MDYYLSLILTLISCLSLLCRGSLTNFIINIHWKTLAFELDYNVGIAKQNHCPATDLVNFVIKQQINSSVILALNLAEQASLGVHDGILLTAPRTKRKEVITNCWERSAYMYWGYVLAKLLHPGEEDLGLSVITRGVIIVKPNNYNRHIPNSSSQFQVLFYFIWPFTRLHFGWKSFHENTKDDEVILKVKHMWIVVQTFHWRTCDRACT